MNDCSLENPLRTEVVVGDIVASRPGGFSGKADDLWEVTIECTINATGVRIQAPSERFPEITSGRGKYQQGLVATCKDHRI